MISTTSISAIDRHLGRRVRSLLDGHPEAARLARAGSAAFAPTFRLAVAAAIATPSRRREGLLALTSAGTAAMTARLAREQIRRPRPGARADAGFPSRHAAAGAAIATSATRHTPGAGVVLWGGMVVGSACRVATGEHEVGDIIAGVVLGVAVATALDAAWTWTR